MKIRNEIGALFMDLQDKLIANVHNPEDLISSNCIWLNTCKLLGINCVITEQVPSKLGPVMSELEATHTRFSSNSQRYIFCIW